MGDGLLYLIAAVVAALCFWWFYARPRGAVPSLITGLPSVLPAIVGVGFVPIGLVRVFRAMASAGLSNPELIALGAAEVLVVPVYGAIFSLLLFVGFLWLRSRCKAKAPAQAEAAID
jgi:hypothetical protein